MPDFCMTDWMRGWSGNMARLTFPRATNVCCVWWTTSIYHRSDSAGFSTSLSHHCRYFKFYDSYRQEHFIFNVQYINVDNELNTGVCSLFVCLFFCCCWKYWNENLSRVKSSKLYIFIIKLRKNVWKLFFLSMKKRSFIHGYNITFWLTGWHVWAADGSGTGQRAHWRRRFLQPGHARVALRQQRHLLHHRQPQHHR